MPTEHGDGDARGRILAAASAEFAAKGVAGARVDAIAKRAGANPQLIYYYFDSKEGLWREVLRRQVDRHVGLFGERQWPEPDDLSGYYETTSEADIRLLMWEALEYGKDQPLEEEGLRYALTRQFVEQIRQQQKVGQLAPELGAAQLLLLELALIMFPLTFPQVARFVSGMSPTDPEFVAAWSQFLRDLVARLAGGTGTGTDNEKRRIKERRVNGARS